MVNPIETAYNGYRFRSRTEARWAIFFDTIGIKYIYEHEGYDLGDGVMYLPDFYLPEINQFFEVKADLDAISDKDKEKIIRLANKTGKYVIVGDSRFRLTGNEPWYQENEEHTDNEFCSCDTYLVKCERCGKLYFENELSYECTACGYYDGDRTFSPVSGTGGSLEYADWKYVNAVNAAKQARFEHGETPNVR